MTLTNDTQIDLVEDRGEMPQHSLRPVRFSELPSHLDSQKAYQGADGAAGGQGMTANWVTFTVDVLGIVIEATPMQGQQAVERQTEL
jgi:hypothetical protein